MAGRKKTTTDNDTIVNDNKNITKKKVTKRKKSEIGIYEHIKKKANVDKILDEWISSYHKDDAEKSVWDLIVLIFDCGGADTTITFQQFKDLEIEEAAKEICEQEDSIQYPLGNKRAKNFLENFKQFWSQIIIKTQDSILFDHYLLDMLVLWFKQTSHAKRSGLRYASTLATIQMATSMIEIAVKLRNELSVVSRQLASETKNTNRQKQLKDNQISITNKLKILETTLIQKMLINVLHHRFRDSLPEIRSMCLAPLSQWILRYPILLLRDDYLKYFGWALNDFATEPRLTSVRGLSVLFGDEDRINQFENFSQRFKHRIIEIAFCDKVPAITVEGINLVSVMSPYDFLDEQDVIKICKLYQIDHPEISSAAGSLIFNKFLSGIQTKIDSVLNTGDSKKKNNDKSNSQILHLRENQLNILLEFLEKTANSNIPYYLVNALWETKARDLFVDWAFWVDYLESIESKNISDKQIGIIVNFLNSSIRIAAGDKYNLFNSSKSVDIIGLAQIASKTTITAATSTTTTPSTPKKKGKPGRKSTKTVSDDESEDENIQEENKQQQQQQQQENEKELDEEVCNQVTTSFLNILPDLITQYRADPIISQGLIEIAKYFQLECYVTLRSQSKYSELLEAICSIYLSQPNAELIDSISETLDYLINNDKNPSQLETTSNNALHNLYTELVDTLRLAKISPPSQSSQSSQSIQSTDDQKQQEDQIFQVIIALKKLDSLGKRFHFSEEDYASLILRFTNGEINGIEIETQDDSDNVVIYSLSIYSQLLLWSFFSNIPEKNYRINPTNLNIVQSFYLYVSRSISILKDINTTHKLKHFVFTTLIETRSIFSPVLDLTNLNSYNIALPIESLLQKTIKDLIDIENQYSIILLKVEFLKNQQTNLEKMKLAMENRLKRAKAKKNETASGANDNDQDEEEISADGNTTNSEKESTSDRETDSDIEELEYEILESEILMVNEFVYDNDYSKRMEDLAVTICNSINFSFVSQFSIEPLLKQIAISSSINCIEITKQFIKDKPASTPNVELEIVRHLIKSFHEICINDIVSSNKEFQDHMFARFRSLIQYLINDYIKHANTLRDIVEHFLSFALKNPNIDSMPQFLEIIQFICTKLSEKSAIDILKKKLVFPDDYPHLDIIKNIYSTIEIQTIQNMDISIDAKKKMKKQPLKFKRSSSTKNKKRRSSKNESSEEEESDSDSEYENEMKQNKQQQQQDDDDEEIPEDDIDPDLVNDRESSEDSSDFEPAEISKKKLRI